MALKRNTLAALMGIAGLLAVAVWAWLERIDHASNQPETLEPFQLSTRPQNDRYLFDYAGAVGHYEEGAQRYLHSIAQRFQIEALIVTVPELPVGYDTSTLAVDLFNRWRIGAGHDGRGLLLLLVDDAKTVKLEVGYQLEGVFTDAFTSWVEDLELGPYYRNGDIGTGLFAVLELLEQRAEMKHMNSYSAGPIARADARLLAGGAGASRSLERYGTNKPTNAVSGGTGARSPEQAWEIMLTQWAGGGKNIDVDVYTAMTRRAMGDPRDPDPRTLNSLNHWRNADYQLLREGDHAVIWFGAIDGWENAPFLFCNTGEGWKFDIVHQRRLVVMGEAPRWLITQGPYPYVSLMHQARQTTSKDLPLSDDDLYRCNEDTSIDTRMRALEKELEQNADSVDATLKLLRLYVITGQRPNLVGPLIDRARQLAPEAAEQYRYAAIYNVNSFFQYEAALTETRRYIELRPGEAFGHQLKGFLLFRLGSYTESIDALQRAVAIDPDDDYAYALMARDFALLARTVSGTNQRRLRREATAMQNQAARVAPPNSERLQRLKRWLKARLG